MASDHASEIEHTCKAMRYSAKRDTARRGSELHKAGVTWPSMLHPRPRWPSRSDKRSHHDKVTAWSDKSATFESPSQVKNTRTRGAYIAGPRIHP
jgi:hypothetical protein